MSPISIITPSYNQGEYLEQTIDSVLSQNVPNLEYFVIDGGSNDNSVEIIKKYEKFLTYWISETDNGQSSGINKGLKKATGEIFAWINSDDYYQKDALSNIVELFRAHPKKGLIYSDVINWKHEKPTIYRHKAQYSTIEFVNKVCFHQPGVFWRSEICKDIGFLNERLHYVMDFEFWLRLYLNYDFLYYPQTTANFRIHSEAKTNDNPLELYEEKELVLTKLFSTNEKNKAALRALNIPVEYNDLIILENTSIPSDELDSAFIQFLINTAQVRLRQKRKDNFTHILKYLRNNDLINQVAYLKLKAKGMVS